jgi:hypothetical protein
MSPAPIRVASLLAALSVGGLCVAGLAGAGPASAGPATAGAATAGAATAGAAKDSAAGHAQRRQLAATTLSDFEVVLTATRSPGTGSAPAATVTASGYRHTASGWRLIATRRIGKANGWSWFATQVCDLKVTQFKPEPSSAKNSDAITVKLLWGPAIGCLGPYKERWRP